MSRKQHKGENGKLLIIGGSNEYVGCLALAGLAALRTGIDLVYVAAPEKVAWTLNAYSPDLITIKLPGDTLSVEHVDTIKDYADKSDAILIGTGAGQSQKTKRLMAEIATWKKPKVIDADALKAVDLHNTKNAILTPHAQEFRLLTGLEPNQENLLKSARPNRVIVLKGSIDLISDGTKVYKNDTGNAGMTVGGTGDILAGTIGGLLATGYDLLDAAIVGTKMSGLSGDMAFTERGYSLLASDVLSYIPTAVKKLNIWNTNK